MIKIKDKKILILLNNKKNITKTAICKYECHYGGYIQSTLGVMRCEEAALTPFCFSSVITWICLKLNVHRLKTEFASIPDLMKVEF